MCKMVGVHPSGFYAWCVQPESKRAKEERRLLGHIKQSWLESGAVYHYPKVSDDLRDLGERCGINRIHRIMRLVGLRSQTGYGKRKWKGGGVPSVVVPNHLQRQIAGYGPRAPCAACSACPPAVSATGSTDR
ncbi:IS3 family transposase [Rugamonas sp. FT29W]|uniref:IS3 family transposase n=1 Tax=Rugamonas aquatica TaxID=2743357 RepID=A0A6A7N6V0_9BURK|nr:IS3 family transposase [Rugamonas aquatica]